MVKQSTSRLTLLTPKIWRRCPFGVAPGPSSPEPFPDGSSCGKDRMECGRGPARRLILILFYKTDLPRLLMLELSARERRNLQAERVRHHALESHSFRRQLKDRRERHARSACRALPHLLAADFCFRLPARLLSRGRRGSHAGFLCHDAER